MAGRREAVSLTHEFAPVFDGHSRILILGTFPSVKSRENHFYYGHPQNRFWRVLASLTGTPLPETIEEKRSLLLENHIAVWDVIQSCEITGSSDSSIRNVVPNDLRAVLAGSRIQKIYANGGTAKRLYERYSMPVTGMPVTQLPSTSPANAAWTLERLLEAWGQIREVLYER